MLSKTNKEVYRIYKRIMYDAKYRATAERYTRSLDILQNTAQTFSQEQWCAVKDYQEAFMELHNEMMRVALQKNRK